MKRMLVFILIAMMLLTLTACSTGPRGTEQVTLTKGNQKYLITFDYDNRTITVDNDVYHYEYSPESCTITYPNGATYLETATPTGAVISWDGDYDTNRYLNGMSLTNMLSVAYEREKDHLPMNGAILLGCPFVAFVGILLAYDPEEMLRLRYRWWFKDVEPSEMAIISTRVSGVLMIVIAAAIFLAAVFL